jgi:HEAT repeat protein
LLRLLDDPEALVRGEAALGLGRLLLRAELDDRDDPRTREIEEKLRGMAYDEQEIAEVRGRAIEAVGARSHGWVTDLIDEAYGSGDRRLRISAVHAMGRNADAQWLPSLLEEMESDDAELRFEAATAAGSIGDEEAIPALAGLTEDEDVEVQEAAIGALGQIGGPAARSVLQGLAEEQRDERVLTAVSDALAEADFADDPLGVRVQIGGADADEDDEDGE